MAYIPPGTDINTDAPETEAKITNPQYTVIIGGHAALFRYSEPSERALLGEYDETTVTEYPWPGKPTGALVDLSYVKLYAQNVRLRYFQAEAGEGYSIYANGSSAIRSSSLIFKTNTARGITYPRSSIFGDRDCAIGDIIDIKGGLPEQTFRAQITGFIGDTLSSVINSVIDDEDNADTQSALTTISKISGVTNNIVASANGAFYSGTESGYLNEIYTITVTQSSSGGDLTTARLRVTSVGEDNVNDVIPSPAGVATVIGTRGLLVTFDSVPPGDNLIAGQIWVVQVSEAFTAPQVTASGSYSGDTDARYIITVTKGGMTPEISAVTTTGQDASGPTPVSGINTPIAIGSCGVFIQFDSFPLCFGDKYYIDVQAAAEGPLHTITLSRVLPKELQSGELGITLYIPHTLLTIPERSVTPGEYNYSLDNDKITINKEIKLYDDSYTFSGVEVAIPLAEATLYVEYRAWLSSYSDQVYLCSTTKELEQIYGAEHPDNELKFALSIALQNSAGIPVYYIAVQDPSSESSWTSALSKLIGNENIYNIVPLSSNETILSSVINYVNTQSSTSVMRTCCCWLAAAIDSIKVLINASTSTNLEDVLATITDDPISGNKTLVTITSNNVDFLSTNIRSGDILRCDYSEDAWGKETYSEYIIDKIQNSESLLLKTPHPSGVTTPAKIEIWRSFTTEEFLSAIKDRAIALNNSRVRYIWPDFGEVNNYYCRGYFLAAALAGLRSGNYHQQSLTNIEISGITSVERSDTLFNVDQLNQLCAAGVWVINTNYSEKIVSRHGRTTAQSSDLEEIEEMVVNNLDSINRGLFNAVRDYLGSTNIVQNTLDQISAQINNKIAQYLTADTTLLGGQLLSGELLSVTQHPTIDDCVVIQTNLTLPAPFNVVSIQQQIIVGATLA